MSWCSMLLSLYRLGKTLGPPPMPPSLHAVGRKRKPPGPPPGPPPDLSDSEDETDTRGEIQHSLVYLFVT